MYQIHKQHNKSVIYDYVEYYPINLLIWVWTFCHGRLWSAYRNCS